MSDEHLPDEANLSKRERQKLRRQRRLEAEQQAAKQAKAKRSIATILVVVLVLGALGLLAGNWWMDRQERAELIREAEGRLEELGCTPIQEQPPGQSPHLSGEQLVSSPPDIVYPDRPATSGPHIGNFVQSGFYDKVIDERLLVHNMEHGYANIAWSPDADPADVADIEEFAVDQIDSGTEKIVASRWDGDLPDGARYAFTAWGARQLCEQWDRGIALRFLDEFHYLEGDAPEKTIRPHIDTGIDPDDEDGDLLLPPLGDELDADPEDAMEQGEDIDEEAGAEDAEDEEPTEEES